MHESEKWKWGCLESYKIKNENRVFYAIHSLRLKDNAIHSLSLKAEYKMEICVQVIYWNDTLRKILYGSEDSRIVKQSKLAKSWFQINLSFSLVPPLEIWRVMVQQSLFCLETERLGCSIPLSVGHWIQSFQGRGKTLWWPWNDGSSCPWTTVLQKRLRAATPTTARHGDYWSNIKQRFLRSELGYSSLCNTHV